MKARFKKGQTIYQIHTNWKYEFDNVTNTTTETLNITEEVVESCGQKRLLLYNDSGRCFKQYQPDGAQGFVNRMCVSFHTTLEEAEKEMNAYIDFHNNKMYGKRTIKMKKMD